MVSTSKLDTFSTEENITAADRMLVPLHPVTVLLGREMLANLARYRRAYRNYWAVTFARVGIRKFPVTGRLRSGAAVNLTKDRVAQLYASEKVEPHPEDDSVVVRVGDRTLSLAGGWTHGDIHGVYVEDVYRWLPAAGRDVVDVGASIGDSPLYFAARGARRVIALEPWPATFELLERNVRANHLEASVFPKNAALGGGRGEITLDDRFESAQHAQIRSFESGTAVPTVPLADLVREYELNDAVLKLDCEGGEYDAILGSSPEVLRRFTHIQMEYHYGYRNLESALRSAGFEVSHTRPFRMVNRASERPEFRMGNMYARRTG
jgi:FkbM family methyltransferase